MTRSSRCEMVWSPRPTLGTSQPIGSRPYPVGGDVVVTASDGSTHVDSRRDELHDTTRQDVDERRAPAGPNPTRAEIGRRADEFDGPFHEDANRSRRFLAEVIRGRFHFLCNRRVGLVAVSRQHGIPERERSDSSIERSPGSTSWTSSVQLRLVCPTSARTVQVPRPGADH